MTLRRPHDLADRMFSAISVVVVPPERPVDLSDELLRVRTSSSSSNRASRYTGGQQPLRPCPVRSSLRRWACYFRSAGGDPDPRMAEAVEEVRSKRQPDGRWLLDRIHPGRVHFDLEDCIGAPSRWNTLRSLQVLDWWDRGERAAT